MPLSSNGSANTTGTSINGTDDDSMTSYWARHELLKCNDMMKNVLIEELISRYEALKQKHEAYVKERSEDEEYVKNFRMRESHLVASVEQLQRIMNREPFILVLIDGDDLIFDPTLLRRGEEGGKRAATLLHNAVSTWAAANVIECPADVKVVIRVYSNIKGLAKVCTTARILTSSAQMEDFVRGFTSGNALCDFVDVGVREHGAEEKVQATFKLHLYDYHCRQILLGCSHNHGYTSMLEQYISDREAVSRITLLESALFKTDLAGLPFSTKDFPGIFLESLNSTISGGLGDMRRDSRALSGASGVFTPRTSSPYAPSVSPGGSMLPLDGQPLALRPSHLRTDSMASSTNSSDNGTKTWARVSKGAASLPFTDLARPASQVDSTPSIRRNRKGQRLDEPLNYDHDEVHRLKKIKLCNQYYIGNGCCHYIAGKPDKCPHRHDLKLSSKDLYNLRVVARETPCKRGTECDDLKCIYGHSCPFPVATEGSMRGVGCLNGEACRFGKEMHGMDKVSVKTIKVTGTF